MNEVPNFSNAELKGVNFAHARFGGANFSGARLTGCSLTDADLRDTNFWSAQKLTGLNLVRTQLPR